MKSFGIKEKSFTNQNINALLGTLGILVIIVLAIIASPDHAGLVDKSMDSSLRIDFINVGQGDSILLRTPKGRNFLIDGGTNITEVEAGKAGREAVHSYIRSLKVRKLDGLVITHWHNDHLSGLLPVLKQINVAVIYEVPAGIKSDAYREYETLCKRMNIKRTTVKAGQILEWGDELFVQVLHPEDTYASEKASEINDDSVVLAVRYGKVQTLLCGDIEEDSEREILKYNEALKSQIVKIPNHGADTSDYQPFLKMVGARVGIISVGSNNPFKYPSNRTLERYEALGTKIYRTDYNGNIHAVISGKDENDFHISVDRNL